MKQSILQNYFLEQFRRPTQRVKIPCGTKKTERIKLPKPAKIDRFEILYDLPKMKKFRDTRFDDPKPFSWDELKEEAKKIGYHCDGNLSEKLTNGKYIFFKCRGNVFLTEKNWLSICFATDRTPDQMLSIMKALQ